jgi:SAM-dependent methyltransferase
VEGYEPSTYGDRFADVYDDWYDDVTDAAACTAHLAHLASTAGGGPVLELGVGSGRLALPLAARGLEVHGIDASPAMLDRLRAKPGGERVHLTVGDMAELALDDPPPFAVVFVAFNTFFNLGHEAQQQRCLERVAALLGDDGRFVLEGFVPPDDVGARAGGVSPRRITADEVVLTVSHVDAAQQTITGQHVHLREAGITLRPWHLRYATPPQLDAMAAQAGLELEARTAGWAGEPFTQASGVHVSTYRRGNVRPVRDQPPATQR